MISHLIYFLISHYIVIGDISITIFRGLTVISLYVNLYLDTMNNPIINSPGTYKHGSLISHGISCFAGAFNEEGVMDFNANTHDMAVIGRIAKRAHDEYEADYITVMMDIEAVHCNGNPLRLDELLKADNFNFLHDIGGINKHINRETGKLEDCFSPRYSA